MGIADRFKRFFFITLRIRKYKLLSNCKRVTGKPKLYHPLLLNGEGKISFGSNVQMGVINSPNYYSHYSYLEARGAESEIVIGDNVSFNNNFSAVAFHRIIIGNNAIIGVNCHITDSDSHFLEAEKRLFPNPPAKEVQIGDNVFLGSNVVILKGVAIGRNSVIGSGSIVTRDIPDNVIAAGNPARVIRTL